MNEQQYKDGLHHPSFHCSFPEERKNLKSYIDQLRLTNEYGGLLTFYSASPDYPNVWEGEAGMMEHIHLPFPMPQTASMLMGHQNQDKLITPSGSGHRHNLVEENVDLDYDVIKTTFPETVSFSENIGLNMDVEIVVADTDLNEKVNEPMWLRSTHKTCASADTKNSKTCNSKLCSNSGGTFNRLFLVDLATKDATKTAAFCDAKILEWKEVLSNTERFHKELQRSLISKHQVCEQYPEAIYRLWRQVCFWIECVHTDMEMERMAFFPNNKLSRLCFPAHLKKNMKKTDALGICKRFHGLRVPLQTMVKGLKKMFSLKKNLFEEYNAKTKDQELKITVPVLRLLHERIYSMLKEGTPLMFKMTPGFAAGVYGKEESVQDRFLRWMRQSSKSNEMLPKDTTDSKESSSSDVIQLNNKDLLFDKEFKTLQNLKADSIDNCDIASIGPTDNSDDRQGLTAKTETSEKHDTCNFYGETIAKTQVVNDRVISVESTASPLLQSINPSLCNVTEYNEFSLKACGIEGSALCTEFDKTYQSWKLTACKIESSLKEIRSVLDLRSTDILLTPDMKAACQALSHAYSLLHSLCTKYVCAKLSQRPTKVGAAWVFSKSVCAMIAVRVKHKLSNRFTSLYHHFKKIVRISSDIWNNHKNVIQLYNEQVEEKKSVRLPMRICDVTVTIRDLIKWKNIQIKPLKQVLFPGNNNITQDTFSCNMYPSIKSSSTSQGACSLDKAEGDVISPNTDVVGQDNSKTEGAMDQISAFVSFQQNVPESDLFPSQNLLFPNSTPNFVNKEQDLCTFLFPASEGQCVSEIERSVKNELKSEKKCAKKNEAKSFKRLCRALLRLKESRNRLSHIIAAISKPRGIGKFEAEKSSQNCMLRLFKGLKECLELLRQRQITSLGDFQIEEIPHHLHCAFQNNGFKVGTGVHPQAQSLLHKFIIAFELVKRKLSPDFIERLGTKCSFVDP